MVLCSYMMTGNYKIRHYPAFCNVPSVIAQKGSIYIMSENIFMANKKAVPFEDYLQYDAQGRGNLGSDIPVLVYRLLEYSLKDELIRRLGHRILIHFHSIFKQLV